MPERPQARDQAQASIVRGGDGRDAGLAVIKRHVWRRHAATWVAEARVGGHHDTRELDIGRDLSRCGEVDVLDSREERVIIVITLLKELGHAFAVHELIL